MTIEEKILKFCQDQWGEKSDEKLANKLSEECGEVCGAVVKIPEGRAEISDLKNELGDVLIVLAQFAATHGETLESLLTNRYKQIMKRKMMPPCAACDRGDYSLGHSDECKEMKGWLTRRGLTHPNS